MELKDIVIALKNGKQISNCVYYFQRHGAKISMCCDQGCCDETYDSLKEALEAIKAMGIERFGICVD